MPIPEIPQGGFELSTGQLGQLEAAGVPLHDPVDNAAPRNVEEFRQIDINNLGWYFCKWPTDFNHEAAGQYGRYMMPHFQRFYVLYKDFVDETHPIEEELNRLTKENLPYYETPTWDERA
ncbi:MAG TPA: hypothetical protein VN778_04640, partial [Verrucomicrobiae bacterium]|nr:hypothetical protein [Verrucomicrobiae bacterium]